MPVLRATAEATSRARRSPSACADPVTQCPEVRGREILGTDGPDNIVGTLGADQVRPRAGNDNIKSRAVAT